MASQWPSSRIIGPLPTSLGEYVQMLAYLYWMGEGRPDGRQHVHWRLALNEVTGRVAYRMWQAARCPHGLHEQHWARAAWEVQVAIRADDIWERMPVEQRSTLSAWIAAERQLARWE